MVVGDTKGGTHQSAGRSERRRMASVKSGGSDGDFERFIFGRSGVGPIDVLLSFEPAIFSVRGLCECPFVRVRVTAMAVCVRVRIFEF